MALTAKELLAKYRGESDRGNRADAVKRLRRFYAGDHWQGDDALPSIDLAWMCVDRIKARVMQGYSIDRVKVVAEGGSYYTAALDHPLRQILAQVPLGSISDAHKEAEVRTALLRALLEQAGADDVIEDLAETALSEGEAALLVGLRDGKPWLEVLTLDQLYLDPQAKRADLSDSRYIGYWTERTVADLWRSYPDARRDIKSDDGDGRDVKRLECWYLRDDSERTVIETLRVEALPGGVLPDEYDDYEVVREILAPADQAIDPMTGQPVAAPTSMGAVVIGFELRRERREPRYPGGWRLVKAVGDVIVHDGAMPYGDEPPIYWLPCYKLPAKADARGVTDKLRALNIAVDKLVGDGIKYAGDAKPFLAMPEGYLADGELEQILTAQGQTVHLVSADNDDMGSVGANVAAVSFPPLPATYEQMIERLKAWMVEIVGADSVLQANYAFDEASGAAVEQLETASTARVAAFRRRLRGVIAKASRSLLQASIQYHSDEVRVNIGGQVIEVVPQALRTDDFERSFDVVLDDSDTLPQSGRQRNQAVLETLRTLASLPPQIMPAVLPLLDLPDKDAFGQIVAQLQQAQQQQRQPDQLSQDIRKRYAESLADGLEELAKTAAKADEHVLALRAMQYLQVAAQTGKVPDVGELIQDITGVRIEQPQQAVGADVITMPQGGQQ